MYNNCAIISIMVLVVFMFLVLPVIFMSLVPLMPLVKPSGQRMGIWIIHLQRTGKQCNASRHQNFVVRTPCM